MVFNWFRRQYSDSSKDESQQKETQVNDTPESASKELDSETVSDGADKKQTSDPAQDYLAWAKTAYSNISKQQSQTDIPNSEEKDTSLDQNVDSLQTSETPEVIETPETSDDIFPDSEETTESSDSVEGVTLSQDTITENPRELRDNQTSSEVLPEVNSQTTQPTGISFLERAAAEKQKKQEQIIANAIEVPKYEENTTSLNAEASVSKVETSDNLSENVQDISDIEFDEGFLWSAEILKAQGRRPEEVSVEEITWLKKLRQGLGKTRRNLLNQLKSIVGQGPLNQDGIDEIESLLIQADVGVEATDKIITTLQNKLKQEALPPEQAIAYLKRILQDMLEEPIIKSTKGTFAPEKEVLNIWLVNGVNGAGKTTTIGKIAHLAQKSGYNCLIGAADTFRAAAVEQVKVWGARSGVEVIANPGKNTDPAAVVFDAISSAVSRNTELLLVDTAGRLQNKKNLMEELTKVRRIIDKKAPDAKVESLLVLDATLGQNGLRQAEVFSKSAQLSGVVLTKLDGSAKGGIALAVVQQLGLPIRFIGAGEGIEDLRPFSSYEFVEALLSG
ncbi:MAG: signal recognition particle-docking protein FtsY [Cyanobacteria bacterium P01_A01_bin.45]